MEVAAAIQNPDGIGRQVLTSKVTGHIGIPAAAKILEKQVCQDVVGQAEDTSIRCVLEISPQEQLFTVGEDRHGLDHGKLATAWFVSFEFKLPDGYQYVMIVIIAQGDCDAYVCRIDRMQHLGSVTR